MADTYEQNLSQKGTLTVNDYIRVVGSDNASYKQLVSDVAKKIIENYTGSSLAGSSQSVKSALDALNSKKIIQTQLNLPSSVAISANSKGSLLTSVDPRDLTRSSLDPVPSTGTLKAAVMLWATNGECFATDTLVQNGLLTIKARNPTASAITITAVRLLLIYE